jgi:hypothetical protein
LDIEGGEMAQTLGDACFDATVGGLVAAERKRQPDFHRIPCQDAQSALF